METTKTGSEQPGGATVDVPMGMPASHGTMGHAPGHCVVSPMCAPLVGGTIKEWRVPKIQHSYHQSLAEDRTGQNL